MQCNVIYLIASRKPPGQDHGSNGRTNDFDDGKWFWRVKRSFCWSEGAIFGAQRVVFGCLGVVFGVLGGLGGHGHRLWTFVNPKIENVDVCHPFLVVFGIIFSGFWGSFWMRVLLIFRGRFFVEKTRFFVGCSFASMRASFLRVRCRFWGSQGQPKPTKSVPRGV